VRTKKHPTSQEYPGNGEIKNQGFAKAQIQELISQSAREDGPGKGHRLQTFGAGEVVKNPPVFGNRRVTEFCI
jgi:hypothetical protein